jgi:DNA-binding transcriptional LysR family regulator
MCPRRGTEDLESDIIVLSVEQLEPNDLLIFARVADSGSFSRAAERLRLPKSTVSRRISRLEEQVGERLMVRTTRRLRLTEFGERLLEHARRIASEIDDAASLAEHRKGRPAGRLRVAIPSDLAILLLSDAIAAFVVLHPAVSLELDLSARRVDLLGENLDLAVQVGFPPEDALLAVRRVAVFPIGLWAAPTYLSDRGEPASPEDLARHDTLRLLGREGEPSRWTLHRGDQHWQGATLGRASANSPELLLRLARAGAGIAAVPDLLATPYARRGELRRVLPEWGLSPRTAWAVLPGRRLMPSKVRAFLDMLATTLPGGTAPAA